MIVLGIDTSGYVNAVGVCDGARVLADNCFPAKTDTLEQIVANIDVTLKSAGTSLKDVEGIGVGLGPGSWTGIKVGVTVGKMLAFSTSKPVIGVPTLEALACSVPDKSLPVYAVIGAGVGDMIYAARYQFKDDEPLRDGDYFAGDVRELAKVVNYPIILAGRDALKYREILLKENEPVGYKLKAKNGSLAAVTFHNVNKAEINEPAQSGDFVKKVGISPDSLIEAVEIEPAGASVACLAAIRLARGQKDEPLSLTPLYLKESTAKIFVNKYLENK